MSVNITRANIDSYIEYLGTLQMALDGLFRKCFASSLGRLGHVEVLENNVDHKIP